MYSKEIRIPTGEGVRLCAGLTIPEGARGLIIFVNGRGSSRFSARNQHIAAIMNRNQIATLLTDLLTEEEDRLFEESFDEGLLSERLTWVTTYVKYLKHLKHLPIGYYGVGEGAAVAVNSASRLQNTIKTIVCNSGGCEISDANFRSIVAPCLFIEESLDDNIRRLNQNALTLADGEKQYYECTRGLFEKPERNGEAVLLTADWFKRHLVTIPLPLWCYNEMVCFMVF